MNGPADAQTARSLFQSLGREDGVVKRAAEKKEKASLEAQLAQLKCSERTSPGKLMLSHSLKQPA